MGEPPAFPWVWPLALLAGGFLLLAPPSARSQEALTKGAFVERFFLNKLARPPAARAYVPEGAEALPPAERYQAVVKGLAERGVVALVGSRPGDPLTRVEYITLTHLLAGGPPGRSLAEQKEFLKGRGALDPADIGFVRAFEGEVTLTRAGRERGARLTGAEPVHFRDLDETALGAKLELQFDDGSTLAVGEDTALTIDEMVYDPKTTRRSIKVALTIGTIRLKTSPNTHPDSQVEVRTPVLTAGIRGSDTIFRVDAQGGTRIINIEGTVVGRPYRVGERRPPPRARRSRPGRPPPSPSCRPSPLPPRFRRS